MNQPLVSFLVCTYGRCASQPEMLNEAVWWCCNQTYENLEVLVLNDAPNQMLCCAHPKVRIVNFPTRFPCLGSKLNAGLALCRGEIALVSHDDDISLPNRAVQAVTYLTAGFDLWHPKFWWHRTPQTPLTVTGNGYGLEVSALRRSAFLGKFALDTGSPDGETLDWAYKNVRCRNKPIKMKSEISYIYRFGVSPTHMSGYADIMKAFREKQPGPDGCFDVVPVMTHDWMKEVLEVSDGAI